MSSGAELGFGTMVRTTDKAILVNLEELGEEKWIPISVIHDDSEVYSEDTEDGEVIVKSWWAEKEGLV